MNSLRRTKSLNTEILDVNICTVHFGRITIVTFRYVFVSCRNQPDEQGALPNTQMTFRKLFISRLRLNKKHVLVLFGQYKYKLVVMGGVRRK